MEKQTKMTDEIRAIAAEVLRIAKDDIKDEVELSTYGISSLATFIFIQRINKHFQCNFGIEDLSDSFSINSVAKFLIENEIVTF